jgi:hypothetical protein
MNAQKARVPDTEALHEELLHDYLVALDVIYERVIDQQAKDRSECNKALPCPECQLLTQQEGK